MKRPVLFLALASSLIAWGNNDSVRATIRFPDAAEVDAFGYLRTISNPETLFESQEIEGKDTVKWVEHLVGGGAATFQTGEASTLLTVGTASGDLAIRQTREYFRYVPGKSQKIVFTGTLGIGKANVRKQAGYYDTNNGIFFKVLEDGPYVCLRTNTSGSPDDKCIPQSDWNIDKLTTPGPFQLDLSKSQVFLIDFQWLGVGRVRVGFNIGGRNIYVHEFLQANVGEGVYMGRPSLPVRYEIENLDTTASPSSIRQICSTVQSEGGHQPIGRQRGVDSGIVNISVSADTKRPVFSLRLNSTHVRSQLIPEGFQVGFNAADTIIVRLKSNMSLTGASWKAPTADSIAEVDFSSTAATGGTTLFTYIVPKAGASQASQVHEIIEGYKLLSDYDGVPDILTIEVLPDSLESVEAISMNWREIR